jgi:hypothetical protein
MLSAISFFEENANGTMEYAVDLARAESRASFLQWHPRWAPDPYIPGAECCKLYSAFGQELSSEYGVTNRDWARSTASVWR